jgi:hypothetical protein
MERMLGQVDRSAVDGYTLAHGFWGLFWGVTRTPWWLSLGFAVGWEIIERPLKRAWPAPFYKENGVPTQDSLANSIGDVSAWMLGWGVGHEISRAIYKRKPKVKSRPATAASEA